MRVVPLTVGLRAWVATAVGTGAFGQAVTCDDGGFGPVTPGSGKWLIEKGKALEMSASRDEQVRPFFATLTQTKTDNIMVSADFEAYDGLGEIMLCPAWNDADNYVAVVRVDGDKVSLVQVQDGVETVLAGPC